MNDSRQFFTPKMFIYFVIIVVASTCCHVCETKHISRSVCDKYGQDLTVTKITNDSVITDSGIEFTASLTTHESFNNTFEWTLQDENNSTEVDAKCKYTFIYGQPSYDHRQSQITSSCNIEFQEDRLFMYRYFARVIVRNEMGCESIALSHESLSFSTPWKLGYNTDKITFTCIYDSTTVSDIRWILFYHNQNVIEGRKLNSWTSLKDCRQSNDLIHIVKCSADRSVEIKVNSSLSSNDNLYLRCRDQQYIHHGSYFVRVKKEDGQNANATQEIGGVYNMKENDWQLLTDNKELIAVGIALFLLFAAILLVIRLRQKYNQISEDILGKSNVPSNEHVISTNNIPNREESNIYSNEHVIRTNNIPTSDTDKQSIKLRTKRSNSGCRRTDVYSFVKWNDGHENEEHQK